MLNSKILAAYLLMGVAVSTSPVTNVTVGVSEEEGAGPKVKIIEIENANLSDYEQFQWLEDSLFNVNQQWQIIARSYEADAASASATVGPYRPVCTCCDCGCDGGCDQTSETQTTTHTTVHETHYYTFAGVTNAYTIEESGKVLQGGVVICETGGHHCLEDHLNTLSYTVNFDGQDYVIYYDGSVSMNDEIICISGGCQCVLDHIYENNYQIYTYNYNGIEITYYIYPDGTVVDTTGQVVAVDGVASLLIYIETTVITTIQQVSYEIDGVVETYTIIQGRVLAEDGTVICETGGEVCLHEYIQSRVYSLAQYAVGEKVYSFKVYPSGKVTDMNDVVICETGGEQCLVLYFEEYITLHYQTTRVSYKIDGVTYYYLIYGNGTVIQEDTKEVICQTGGQDCLTSHVEAQMYSIAQYSLSGTVYTFKIYPDGRVYDEHDVLVCATGGQTCLNTYIDELAITLQKTQVSYNIDGVQTIFYIDYYGKVTDVNGAVICETGGQECLEIYVQSQLSQFVQYSIEGTVYIYEITSTGMVLAEDGTVICETGGQACLDLHIEELKISLQKTRVSYNINGVKTIFIIDSKGMVTYENGTVVCETGGEVCLETYIQTIVYSIAEYDIAGTVYVFYVYQSGLVTDDKANVICETGGEQCLTIYVQELAATLQTTRVEYNINGVKTIFIIDYQGKVTTEIGEVICTTGGEVCLKEYVDTIVYNVVEYTVDKVLYIFHIYKNGTVYSSKGELICSTGGEVCLQDHIDFLIRQSQQTVVTYTVNNVLMTFTIDYQGKVVDSKGKVICETGGEQCLEAWVNAQIETYEVISVDVMGELMKFYYYSDGRVIEVSTGNQICAVGGGEACLNEYLNSLLPVVRRTVYDINGIGYTFYIDEGSGLVWDTSNNIICATGGQPCLEEYVDMLTFSMDTINGVKYRVYSNGTVFNADGTEMICETGGQACVLKSLGISLSSQGVQEEGNTFRYAVFGAILIAALLAALYLVQKRQNKNQHLFMESNLRQSLLQ